MTSRNDKPPVSAAGDHEVITPEHKLRQAVSSKPFKPGDDDPVARAEKSLAELSGNFAGWMEAECERLDKARRMVVDGGFNKSTKEALFHAAHDIKGEAATFGFPAMTGVANSLCRLIEHTPDLARVPVKLVEQHVDAVRAIYREYARSDAVALAHSLTRRLRAVTDEFLMNENRDRPDVLEQIKGPPLAPE